MFKKFFFLALFSSVASIVACLIYSGIYANLIVDFSEGISTLKMISNNLVVSMSACFIAFAIHSVVKNKGLAEFLFNALFSLVAIVFVFAVLNADDPKFKSENAILFAEFYKGYLMAMLFFPVLTWFTFKPLFIKS